jgi:hypothetical protein
MEKGTEFEDDYEYDCRNERSIREKGLIEEPGSHSTFELSQALRARLRSHRPCGTFKASRFISLLPRVGGLAYHRRHSHSASASGGENSTKHSLTFAPFAAILFTGTGTGTGTPF